MWILIAEDDGAEDHVYGPFPTREAAKVWRDSWGDESDEPTGIPPHWGWRVESLTQP